MSIGSCPRISDRTYRENLNFVNKLSWFFVWKSSLINDFDCNFSLFCSMSGAIDSTKLTRTKNIFSEYLNQLSPIQPGYYQAFVSSPRGMLDISSTGSYLINLFNISSISFFGIKWLKSRYLASNFIISFLVPPFEGIQGFIDCTVPIAQSDWLFYCHMTFVNCFFVNRILWIKYDK